MRLPWADIRDCHDGATIRFHAHGVDRRGVLRRYLRQPPKPGRVHFRHARHMWLGFYDPPRPPTEMHWVLLIPNDRFGEVVLSLDFLPPETVIIFEDGA